MLWMVFQTRDVPSNCLFPSAQVHPWRSGPCRHLNHILQDENSILDFTLGSGTLHYMPVLEPWKCGFVCLTSGMFWVLNPPGCRTEIGSQERGICSFFGSLILRSSQKWPQKCFFFLLIGNPVMRKDRNIMGPFPVVCPEIFTHSAPLWSEGDTPASSLLRWIPR